MYRDWDSNPSWRKGWNKTNGSAIEIVSICRPNKTIKSKCFRMCQNKSLIILTIELYHLCQHLHCVQRYFLVAPPSWEGRPCERRPSGCWLPPLSTPKSEIAAVCSLLLNSELYSLGKYSQSDKKLLEPLHTVS